MAKPIRVQSVPEELKRIIADLNRIKRALMGKGTTRPTSPIEGQMFFDSTLGHPIWYDGANWVDAAGNNV